MSEPSPVSDFSSVYSAHAAYVRRVLTRRGVRAADLDDAQQEVFVIVHRQLPGFEGRARIETWLHSVAWRVAANYHRRDRAQGGASAPPADSDDPQLSEAMTEVRPGARLRALLSDIDERHRDLLALHEIGGLSISELSDLTGNARATIRHALERARVAVGRRLWSALTQADDEAWIARLAPRYELQPIALPLAEPVIIGRNAFSCVGDTVIAVWRGECTVESIEELLPIMFALAEAGPQGLRFLSVIEPSSAPPVRQARDLNVWGIAKLGPALRAAAWVAESSYLVSVVAPVMNTTFFLAGVPLNARFFDELTRATRWLGEHGPRDVQQITSHVEMMRRRLTDAGIH